MTTRARFSIDRRLLTTQVVIDSALAHPGILAAIRGFGYDETHLVVDQTLYQEALALVNRHKVEYGEQYQATAAVKSAWAEAQAAYMRTLKVARAAFKNDAKACAALMLNGPRRRALSGWLEQAQTFYANLLGDAALMAVLAGFGYDRAKLETEQALVQAVQEANLTQEITKQRDAWLADFRVIARVALEEHAQWLEILGIVA